MPRWEGNARERFEKAALELFDQRGYAGTTVSDIAEHAGLTERTFFRYFKDKPEVLFYGGEILQQHLAGFVTSAPKTMSPLDAVVEAFAYVAAEMERRRDLLISRHRVIAEHPDLRERESDKSNMLTAAMAEALRGRKVSEPGATLAATTGMAVFHVAYERWLSESKPKDLLRHLRTAHSELVALVKKSKA